ncbi:hypothetical protein C0J52_00856 [Blattella germanica]|nr:hypothetical protein C0J52_00856 [Blattella germanica]
MRPPSLLGETRQTCPIAVPTAAARSTQSRVLRAACEHTPLATTKWPVKNNTYHLRIIMKIQNMPPEAYTLKEMARQTTCSEARIGSSESPFHGLSIMSTHPCAPSDNNNTKHCIRIGLVYMKGKKLPLIY